MTPAILDPADDAAQVEAHPGLLVDGRDQPGDLRPEEGPQRRRLRCHHRHFQAAGEQRRGYFEADEPGPDHHPARRSSPRR